ncbi:MAG TPA: hypothetical protein PLR25_15745 [Planctomycetaceae bacterium]|nr:hypothetical protein [Planctomycetaceae bacterium]
MISRAYLQRNGASRPVASPEGSRPTATNLDPEFVPLNIACVFSPPAEGNPDVKQIQEDLPQEKTDNE